MRAGQPSHARATQLHQQQQQQQQHRHHQREQHDQERQQQQNTTAKTTTTTTTTTTTAKTTTTTTTTTTTDNSNHNNNKVARAFAAARGVSFICWRILGQKPEDLEFRVVFVNKRMFRSFFVFLVFGSCLLVRFLRKSRKYLAYWAQ